jgi:2'-5' RNA ligase
MARWAIRQQRGRKWFHRGWSDTIRPAGPAGPAQPHVTLVTLVTPLHRQRETVMTYALELSLDERADDQVRQIWAALDEGGIRSLASVPGTRFDPHVSLSVFEHFDPAEVAEALRPLLATSAGMPLSLALLGFFLTDEAPVFLGVVPSSRLLTLHHAVHQRIEPLVDSIWPYYRPDALVPHCTLAMGVADKAKALQIVARFPLPIHAVVSGARLVQLPAGHVSIQLAPG